MLVDDAETFYRVWDEVTTRTVPLIRVSFSGMVELSSCRFLNCAEDVSGQYSAVKIADSTAMSGWRIHSNLTRDAKSSPTMKHGFDLKELADSAEALIGSDNYVRGSREAGYVVRSHHSKFTTDRNVGTFELA